MPLQTVVYCLEYLSIFERHLQCELIILASICFYNAWYTSIRDHAYFHHAKIARETLLVQHQKYHPICSQLKFNHYVIQTRCDVGRMFLVADRNESWVRSRSAHQGAVICQLANSTQEEGE